MSKIKIFVSRDWAPIRLGTLTRALPLLLVLAVLITAGALSQAQSNFTVIHTFTGPDGSHPYSAPNFGQAGQPVWDNVWWRSSGTRHWFTSWRMSTAPGFCIRSIASRVKATAATPRAE